MLRKNFPDRRSRQTSTLVLTMITLRARACGGECIETKHHFTILLLQPHYDILMTLIKNAIETSTDFVSTSAECIMHCIMATVHINKEVFLQLRIPQV